MSKITNNKPAAFDNSTKDEHFATSEEPSAELNGKEPSAGLSNKEPSAGLSNKEPSARLNKRKPVTDIERQTVHWFLKMSDKKASYADWRAFRTWLAQSPAHMAVYEKFLELWENPYFEKTLRQKYAATDEKPVEKKSAKTLLKLVACTPLAASLLFVAFTWVDWFSPPAPVRTERMLYQTAIGEQRTVTLSDGSAVTLDTDTQLHVAFEPHIRKLTLTRGTAYFEVKKDGRPFWVQGGTGLVRVMGTAFEVRVNTKQMKVSVERGRVAVSPQNDTAQYLEVTPRQQAAVTLHHLGKVEYQGFSEIADWRDGWLEFHDRPLGEVIAELDKYYFGNISLNDKSLSRIRINGQYHIQDVRGAIKRLALYTRLNYSVTGTGDIVFSNPH